VCVYGDVLNARVYKFVCARHNIKMHRERERERAKRELRARERESVARDYRFRYSRD
jgi:hypothetical protein